MKIILRRLFNKEKQDYSELEADLKRTLIQVEPRKEFVQKLRIKLRAKLDEAPAASIKNTQFEKSQILLISAAGILSAVLMLVVSIRAALTLIAAVSLLIQIKRQPSEKDHTPLTPAV